MYSCFIWNKRWQNPFSVAVLQGKRMPPVKLIQLKWRPALPVCNSAGAVGRAARCCVCCGRRFLQGKAVPFPRSTYKPRRKPLCEVSKTNSCDMPLRRCPREYIKNTEQTSSELLEQLEITLALDGATANHPLPIPALLCVSADLCWWPKGQEEGSSPRKNCISPSKRNSLNTVRVTWQARGGLDSRCTKRFPYNWALGPSVLCGQFLQQ